MVRWRTLRDWGVVVTLLLIVTLALSGCAGDPPGPPLPGEEPATETTPAQTPPAADEDVQNEIVVQDQELGPGYTVTIDSVTARTLSWVVIHADGNGQPGPVIGQTQVEPGNTMEVVVDLDQAQVTDTLYAMLHVDEGIEGEFEFPGPDAPAVDDVGAVVVESFQVTVPQE
jgi:hypothetical protein